MIEYQRQFFGMVYLLNYCVNEAKDMDDIVKEVGTMCEEMIAHLASTLDIVFKT